MTTPTAQYNADVLPWGGDGGRGVGVEGKGGGLGPLNFT